MRKAPKGLPGQHRVLEGFMREIERLTGLRMGLYDLKFFTADSPKLQIDVQRQSHGSPVCELMKSCPKGLAKCIQVENQKAQEAVRYPDGRLHTCYAGVSDFLLPLEVQGQHAGTAFLGQTLTLSAGKERELETQLASRFGLPIEKVRKAFAAMPQRKEKELRLASRALHLVKGFIEQLELILTMDREYGLLQYEGASTAEEAVRKGKIPFRRLAEARSRLSGAGSEPIRLALDLIQQHYRQSPKHSEVAKKVGLSASHFSREFHRQTGHTFRRALLETRLSVALFLIKKYHVTVSEAAYLVGYSDEICFRRAFRKLRGRSPKSFMKAFPRAYDVIE